MKEPVRDIERLRHILEQIDNLAEVAENLTLETLDAERARYYGIPGHEALPRA